jgi:elongation factor P
MKDGMVVEVNFHNDKPITVDIDPVVELEIVDTPPNFKGDSQGGKKPATLETGAVVQIPFHLVNGDRIKVDTAEGKYLEKAK